MYRASCAGFASIITLIAFATPIPVYSFYSGWASPYSLHSDNVLGGDMFAHEPRYAYQSNGEFGYSRPSSVLPCPRYVPMKISSWTEAPRRRLHIQASQPGSLPEHRKASLSGDEQSFLIRAIRRAPDGGRQCLPAGALLSEDGRYEILEASVPVPFNGDIAKATSQKTDEGLEIIVPFTAELPRSTMSSDMPTPARRPAAVSSTAAQLDSALSTHQTSSYTDLAHSAAKDSSPTSAQPVASKEPAPLDGILVQDEESDWPEKSADAASGWWDNRGEFQEY